jgi:hypothetical protein
MRQMACVVNLGDGQAFDVNRATNRPVRKTPGFIFSTVAASIGSSYSKFGHAGYRRVTMHL